MSVVKSTRKKCLSGVQTEKKKRLILDTLKVLKHKRCQILFQLNMNKICEVVFWVGNFSLKSLSS